MTAVFSLALLSTIFILKTRTWTLAKTSRHLPPGALDQEVGTTSTLEPRQPLRV